MIGLEEEISVSNKQKECCCFNLIQQKGVIRVTPGSWPARTPKNPVIPTTVKRKAACITERHQTYWNLCNSNNKSEIPTKFIYKF